MMKNDGFELIRSIYYDYSSVCASICDSEHRSASVLHPTRKNYPIVSVTGVGSSVASTGTSPALFSTPASTAMGSTGGVFKCSTSPTLLV